MTAYQRGKNAAREQAISWQANSAEQSPSWGEIAAQQRQLEQLARRYGLLREFRENAII